MLPCICPVIETSKCGKNKKVAHEATAECVSDVLTTFWHPLWSITGRMHGNMESICFIKERNKVCSYKSCVISRKTRESGAFLAFPILTNTKKALWRHLWSIQNESIPLVAMDWQRIVIGLGKSCHCQTWLECGMKTYSEGRIELQNLQFFKKMLEKSTQCLSSDQPCEPKSLEVALNIAGVEKYIVRLENFWLWSTWRPFDSSFERKRVSVTMEIYVLCGRWFSNQFEIVSETPFLQRCAQFAVSCCELYFACCCAVNWTGTFASGSKVVSYLTFRRDVLIFCFP